MGTLEIVVEIEINLDELLAFEQALALLPERVGEVLVGAMQEAEDIAYLELATYPEPPSPPINWDSERQKRAFFSTNGFGGGIPHERQDLLPGSFEESEIIASEGLIEAKVFTPEEWAHFVMGKDQSNIHVGRWETDTQIGERIAPEVKEIFSNALVRAVTEALSAK